MLIVGFAGGSGSGKTLASGFFLKFNIPSIDTDSIYRKMTVAGGKCIEPLRRAFGDSVITSDGSLDRAILAGIIFASEEKRRQLNSITHKMILEEVREIIEDFRKNDVPAVLIDAPLLFESGFDKECDIIISVISDIETRIDRIIERDGITRDKALARINAQHSDDFLIEKSNFIIINNSSPEYVEAQVNEIAKKILTER